MGSGHEKHLEGHFGLAPAYRYQRPVKGGEPVDLGLSMVAPGHVIQKKIDERLLRIRNIYRQRSSEGIGEGTREAGD